MTIGKVKWFNFKKGYGFIVPEQEEKDVFVHITSLHSSGLRGLKEEQKVQFEMKVDENGRASASNISLLEV